MNQETRSIIEGWWQTHSLTDYGWLFYRKELPNVCNHKDIVASSFELWQCNDCGKIAPYDELRKKQ